MDQVLGRKNIYDDLFECIKSGIPCTLATVTATYGSTPQKPGSSAVIGKQGIISGTVGGGISEHFIQEKAIDSIQTGKSGYFHIDLDKDISDPEGAICGGGMSIIIDSAPEKYEAAFNELKESVSRRISGVLITFTGTYISGDNFLKRKWITKESLPSEKTELNEKVAEKMEEMLNRNAHGDFKEIHLSSDEKILEHIVCLELVTPPSRLIIAGAGHVGKALCHLAVLLDFEVLVWDDRPDFANEKNLPDADNIFAGELAKCLGEIGADRNTYVVIATRGHKNDSEVLRLFIRSNAGYIGMMVFQSRTEKQAKG